MGLMQFGNSFISFPFFVLSERVYIHILFCKTKEWKFPTNQRPPKKKKKNRKNRKRKLKKQKFFFFFSSALPPTLSSSSLILFPSAGGLRWWLLLLLFDHYLWSIIKSSNYSYILWSFPLLKPCIWAFLLLHSLIYSLNWNFIKE